MTLRNPEGSDAACFQRWKNWLRDACAYLKDLTVDGDRPTMRASGHAEDASQVDAFDKARPQADSVASGRSSSRVPVNWKALSRLTAALIEAGPIGYENLRVCAAQLLPELATLQPEDLPGHLILAGRAMNTCLEIGRRPEQPTPDAAQIQAWKNLLLQTCITALVIRAARTPREPLTPSNIESAVRRCFPDRRALDKLTLEDATSRLGLELKRELHPDFVAIVLLRFFGNSWQLPESSSVVATAHAVRKYHEEHPDGPRPVIADVKKTLNRKIGTALIRYAVTAYYGSVGGTDEGQESVERAKKRTKFDNYLANRARRPLIDRVRSVDQMQWECFRSRSGSVKKELLSFIRSCANVHPISFGLYVIGELPEFAEGVNSLSAWSAGDDAHVASAQPHPLGLTPSTLKEFANLAYGSPALRDLLVHLQPARSVVALGDSVIDRAAARAFERLDWHVLLGDIDLSVHLGPAEFEESMQALAAAFGVRRVDPSAVSTDRDVANLAAARTRDDGPSVKRPRGAEPQPQPQFTSLDPATSTYHDALRALIGQAQQQMARQPQPLATGYAAPVSAVTSAEVAASIATTAVALPVTPAFATSRLVVQANPGGGSCLLHALAGATLTPDQIQGVRRAMAHELAQRPDTRGGPALNTMRLMTALHQTAAGPDLLRNVPAGLEMPNAVYAECLALHSHYLGYEDIALYCQLHDRAQQHAQQPTRPLRVLVIAPSGELVHVTAAGEQTQRPRQPGEAEQAVQDALQRGDVVIHHSGDHFTRVLGFRRAE